MASLAEILIRRADEALARCDSGRTDGSCGDPDCEIWVGVKAIAEEWVEDHK